MAPRASGRTAELPHEGLAALDLARPEVLLVTRNLDDLHERSRAQALIHTHGELLKVRCTICTKVGNWFDDLSASDRYPICGNVGHLRPRIVWVGEEPLRVDIACVALATCKTPVDRQCRRRRAGPFISRRRQARRRSRARIRP